MMQIIEGSTQIQEQLIAKYAYARFNEERQRRGHGERPA
jgi:hypothetical protein